MYWKRERERFCIIWFLSLCIRIFFPSDFCVQYPGTIPSRIESQQRPLPSVIVIGAGISGIAAARNLYDASFKVSYHYWLSFLFIYSFYFLELVQRKDFLLLSVAYFHHVVRSLYWSHGTGLVVAFILTTHLVVQLTWEPHGKFNLVCWICSYCTHRWKMSRICALYSWTSKLLVESVKNSWVFNIIIDFLVIFQATWSL